MTGPRGVHETVMYLGYTIKVEESKLTIWSPDGLLLVSGRIGLATARKMIREQRGDDQDASHDRAEQEREYLNHEYEAVDHARQMGRTE